MIVLDIETSGIHPEKHGIWQIGALDFSNPKNTFLEEARIDEEDEFTEEASKIHGKTENYLRDKNKQTQKDLIKKFFEWVKNIKIKNLICQNPQFDANFIISKALKYNLDSPLHYRTFDLHSFVAFKHLQLNKKFLLEEDHSGMSLKNKLKFCGLEDKREDHNALEDVKLTAECFSSIIRGKSLLKKYSKYKIPEYLAK